MPGAVPDRWLSYKPYGEVIKDTKILAFKVPLKEAIAQNLDPNERFTPAMLLEAFPNLKYIIDLTNTHRYYDNKEFTDAGVRYQKIMIRGREVPDFNNVKTFFRVMDDFMSASEEGEIIGIHCTHGINRTGYLICRYLVQQLGWEHEKAIKAFEEARGYPIERGAYIAALKRVSSEDKIDTSTIDPPPVKDLMGPPLERPKLGPRPIGPPPGFLPMPRRLFPGPFPPPKFGVGGPRPGFGPIPPPPPPPPPPVGMPAIPPPRPRIYMNRHRPQKYGLRIRPVMPPPPPLLGPAFPNPRCSVQIPRPPPIDFPAGIPPSPQPRLPPPPLPLVPPARPMVFNNHPARNRKAPMRNGVAPDMLREEDFTVDTFEENLLAGSTNAPYQRRTFVISGNDVPHKRRRIT